MYSFIYAVFILCVIYILLKLFLKKILKEIIFEIFNEDNESLKLLIKECLKEHDLSKRTNEKSEL